MHNLSNGVYISFNALSQKSGASKDISLLFYSDINLVFVYDVDVGFDKYYIFLAFFYKISSIVWLKYYY